MVLNNELLEITFEGQILSKIHQPLRIPQIMYLSFEITGIIQSTMKPRTCVGPSGILPSQGVDHKLKLAKPKTIILLGLRGAIYLNGCETTCSGDQEFGPVVIPDLGDFFSVGQSKP
jgi:hypothetical protein